MTEQPAESPTIDTIFKFKPGDREPRVVPKDVQGELTAVCDVFQVLEVAKNEDVKVVERAVIGCCILEVNSEGKKYYFHLPPGGYQTLFTPSDELTSNQKAFAASLKACRELQNAHFTYIVNGFHEFATNRRIAAAKQLHQTLFPNSLADFKVISRDQGVVDDLSHSINIIFQNGQVALPEGYRLNEVEK